MLFMGKIDPGGIVVLVHVENFVPILFVHPRVILSFVSWPITNSNVLTRFLFCCANQVRGDFVLSPGAFPSPS